MHQHYIQQYKTKCYTVVSRKSFTALFNRFVSIKRSITKHILIAKLNLMQSTPPNIEIVFEASLLRA